MKYQYFLIFNILIICLLFLVCEPISPPGKESSEMVSELKGIPAEYGKLVAVTTTTAYPLWAQLWFEDEQHTIRMVRVHWMHGVKHDKVITIPRINN